MAQHPLNSDLETVLDAEALTAKSMAQPICNQCAVSNGAWRRKVTVTRVRSAPCCICGMTHVCASIADWSWEHWDLAVDRRPLETKRGTR